VSRALSRLLSGSVGLSCRSRSNRASATGNHAFRAILFTFRNSPVLLFSCLAILRAFLQRSCFSLGLNDLDSYGVREAYCSRRREMLATPSHAICLVSLHVWLRDLNSMFLAWPASAPMFTPGSFVLVRLIDSVHPRSERCTWRPALRTPSSSVSNVRRTKASPISFVLIR
jgi:hypothetical protein